MNWNSNLNLQNYLILVVADTSWSQFGVASEVNRIINEIDPRVLKCPVVSMGMQPAPCPTAKSLEDLYYPDVHDLVNAIAELHLETRDHNISLPKKESMTDFYKHFKGPF